MFELFKQLPDTAISISILLMVATIKTVVSRTSSSNNQSIFSLYCLQLASKVNKSHHSDNHKKIAGFIATTITYIPIVVILVLFGEFVAINWLWSALLLYVSLGPNNLNQIGNRVANSLAQQNTNQAKALLKPHVLRDVNTLSPIGICKTTIEMLILKKLQYQFIVGFYFIVFGPIAAISYRLFLEMHYQWNTKQPQFASFGKFSAFVTNLFQWLPSRLFLLVTILTTLNQQVGLFYRLVKAGFFSLSNTIVIHYFSYSLATKLGGVAMYDQVKLRRVNLNNDAHQPEIKHITNTIKQLNLVMTLSWGLLLSLLILLVTITITSE